MKKIMDFVAISNFRIVLTITIISLLFFSNKGNTVFAADVQKKPIIFYHESFGRSELQALIKNFNFKKYISNGENEYEKMLLLKDWTYRNLLYDKSFKTQNLRNALKILRKSKKGKTFLCTNFAAVFMQCAVSMGWTSRYFFVRKPTGEQHANNDIWSNQFKKWIFIDSSWNIHVEKNNIPLSIIEIRKEWIKNKGEDLIYIYGAGEKKISYIKDDFPVKRKDSKIWKWWPIDNTWLSYTYEIALVGRNNFFSYREGDGKNIWSHMYIIKDRINKNDKKWPFRRKIPVKDPRHLFHDLNRVDIKVNKNFGSNSNRIAEVRLNAFGRNNFTPNLKKFLVSINNNNWQEKNSIFKFRLIKGKNVIRCFIVNKFGVKGPISSVKIYFK